MFGTNFMSYLIFDASASDTVLAIEDTSGWQAGDEICIASTSQTPSECEKRTILTVDSPTQITVTSGLTNAHSGASPTQAEVGNLTRNIRIRGQTGALQSYVNIAAKAEARLGHTEFYFLGSTTANKRGIDIATTIGTFNIQSCSIHDGQVASSRGININSASGDSIIISYNLFYNFDNIALVNVATSGVMTINNNLYMRSISAGLVSLLDVGGIFINNIIVGGTSTAFVINESLAAINIINNNTIHSSNGGISSNNIRSGILSNSIVWRSSSSNGSIVITASSNLVFDGLTAFGNSTSNVRIASGNTMCRFIFNNLISNGDTTFATTSGFQLNDAADITFNDCDFSTVSGIKTAHTNDILVNTANSLIRLVFNNCKLGGANEIGSLSNLATNSFIGSQKHDQVVGSHKTWKREGILTIDTTTGMFDTSPSIRLTPSSTTEKLSTLGSLGGWIASVPSGGTVTISIKIRKSVIGDGAAYNGNQPRLILKQNSSLGLTDDMVLATATASSDGAFETLTVTTPTALDDYGVFEFYVDCDGNTGWVNVDSLVIS